jgi:release factor glutamine methyltransferase
MITIGEAEIKISESIQAIYGADEAKAIAQLVLCHVCGVSKVQLILKKQDPLYTMEERSVNLILSELINGRPVQYILGETEFYGLQIKVTPSVLIPRPETEELVEWVLKEAEGLEFGGKGNDSGIKSILDIGTGSGCIPIALKKHLPEAGVYGLDVSAKALEVARENAALNDVDVQFICTDILQPVTHKPTAVNCYDIIVSNPPYITQSEKERMHQNVLDHEPHLALFVSDEDPLLFYKAIADFALNYLAEKGRLFLEINEFLGDQTLAMLQEKGFKNAVLRKDLQGKDRMIRVEL